MGRGLVRGITSGGGVGRDEGLCSVICNIAGGVRHVEVLALLGLFNVALATAALEPWVEMRCKLLEPPAAARALLLGAVRVPAVVCHALLVLEHFATAGVIAEHIGAPLMQSEMLWQIALVADDLVATGVSALDRFWLVARGVVAQKVLLHMTD